MRIFFFKVILIGNLLFASCNGQKVKQTMQNMTNDSENAKVEEIELNYVNMYIITPFAIGCQDFDGFFTDDSKKLVLRLQNQSEQMENFNNYFEDGISNEIANGSINTRMRAKIIYSDSTVVEICFGRHIFQYEGKNYPLNDEFQKLMLKITNSRR